MLEIYVNLIIYQVFCSKRWDTRDAAKKVIYRFDKSSDPSYPAILELFSRNLIDILLKHGGHLAPAYRLGGV